MDYKMLIAPVVAILTSVIINAGIDVEEEQLKIVLNAILTFAAGGIAHLIATRKAKKTP